MATSHIPYSSESSLEEKKGFSIQDMEKAVETIVHLVALWEKRAEG